MPADDLVRIILAEPFLALTRNPQTGDGALASLDQLARTVTVDGS